MKRVIYAKSASKVLDNMQPKRRLAIRAKVDAFARGENVDVKRLRGSPHLRIRVGDDRVVLEDLTDLVFVVEVGPRGGIYRK